MLDKKAIRYVVFFLFVFEIVFAVIAYEDVRCIAVSASLMHLKVLSIEGYRQAVSSTVGWPWYGFFNWLNSWYSFSIVHDLLLVLVISVILFTLGIIICKIIKKIADKQRGFSIVE